ncbi:MAG TPA: galactose oxidase early set domain-containing protein, partial [Mycobacteriales bacterium]|nr:galactose oxidase early set domain-containing protein [Mycobacteriales bacterium]
GMNRVQYNVVAEFGDVAQDDQSRLADFRPTVPTFATPGNQTGAPTDGHGDPVNPLLPGGVGAVDSPGNDYDLFCSPLIQLADGTVLAAGGTKYYTEPGVTDPTSGKTYGVSELQGLKATRIFDPRTNTWHNAKGDMHFGRWYPTLVTLANGHVFVASGVTKLIKPAYNDGRPVPDNGRNVVETETYDPSTQLWTVNHSSQTATNGDDTSEQSLPLFARLHLLPDGKVYYDAAGQTFNPDGQAYDEGAWVFAKVYDPATQAWSNLTADTPTGAPLVDGAPVGFRGSGFDVMLPLRPDANGNYTTARVLNGGGVVGPTPGSYQGDSSTTINTIDTSNGGDALHSAAGPNLLNARWYGSAVVLPDGTVFVTNGANRDEVDMPGSGSPVMQTELIDPDAGTVTAGPSLADGHDRTYHNSAVLLPDGRVLIGGHAPIATGYAFQSDAGSAAGLSSPENDSSFQIYSPPYLSYGPRPKIKDVANHVSNNQSLDIDTDGHIDKVVLVRDPSITHLTDGDQRTVELRTQGNGGDVKANVPSSDVVPPGPYMLFVERAVNVGGAMKLVPSLSRPVTVTGGSGAGASTTLAPAQERSASAGHRRHHVAAEPPATSASVAAVPGRLLQARPVAASSAARRDRTWAGAAGVGFALAALAGYRRRRRQLGPLREAA